MEVLKKILSSKKFLYTVLTVLLHKHGPTLGLDPSIVLPAGIALIAGQGLADLGKERKV